MAATATSYAFSAAPPGPVIPPAPAILAIPGIAPPQLAPFALPGFPSNLQALQGLLSQPGMLPLLQTLMAAQASAMAYPPFPAPLAGMPLPGILAATAASVPAVVPVPPTSAAPVALTANPSDPPPPPPQLPIPPLPPPEEEEPEEVIPKVTSRCQECFLRLAVRQRKRVDAGSHGTAKKGPQRLHPFLHGIPQISKPRDVVQ